MTDPHTEKWETVQDLPSGLVPEVYRVGNVVARKTDDTVWVVQSTEVEPEDEDNDQFFPVLRVQFRAANEAEKTEFAARMERSRQRNLIAKRAGELIRCALVLTNAIKPDSPVVAGVRYRKVGNPLTSVFADVDCLWHVRENGDDGDNWSRNNAPGEIVHRFEYTPELRELVELMNALGMGENN